MSSRFSERLCLKTVGGEQLRELPEPVNTYLSADITAKNTQTTGHQVTGTFVKYLSCAFTILLKRFIQLAASVPSLETIPLC